MKIRPLTDHVLVEILKQDRRVGGIYIPDGAHQDKLIPVKVVAVGPGRWSETIGQREPLGIEPGDVVLVDDAVLSAKHFPQWQLTRYEGMRPDASYHLVKADAIRAVDEGKEALAAAE